MSPLILASTSRYRRELLERLRLPFEVEAPLVDEAPLGGETPQAAAVRLAAAKAAAVAAHHPRALVIGSDQTATLDGRAILGKPGGRAAARAQLRAASGRMMHFHTALALRRAEDGFTDDHCVDTQVRFRALDDRLIDAYLDAEQPWDCAGSAKSEGLGVILLESIEGPDPTALIGLPLIALTGALMRAGVSLPGPMPAESN
ncbi:MAG TPA: Maf family nucleotide pyrophosphatase [Burkholderiaceae bacterium]|nr:Maf family nucleotide pyrophosphatase [Burkholderiaceae bacterium]